MSVGVLIELRVKHEYQQRFLLATRLYGHRTRNEPGRPRVDISERDDCAGEFVIREIFSNRAQLEAHGRTEHAREWLSTVAEFINGEIGSRRFSVVTSGPPPLPQGPRRPALETSTVLPATHAEAAKWWAFSNKRETTPREAEPTAAPEPWQPLHLPRLQVGVERLEVASLHDRFLRGAPDPCFVVGCYTMDGVEVESLGRALYRFTLDRPAPCELLPRQRLLDLPVLVERFPLRLCVLLLAFEENGGTDIRAAYQELSDPASFFVWSANQPEPNPMQLGHHAAQLRLNHCDRVQLLREGETLHDATQDDTWIGAASGVIEFSERGQERLLRYHTRSTDERNDWVTELSFRFE